MKQEKVWDDVAKSWNEYRNIPLKEVVEFLKGKKGKILDLGCGTGRHFSLINGEIYGVDFSNEMLKLAELNAKKNKIKCSLIKADVTNLSFEDNFFDYAIFIAALHCIKGDKKRRVAVKEMYRVLKKGGKAVISVWSKNHEIIHNRLGDISVPWTLDGRKLQRHYYIYEREELRKLLEKTGFKILEVKEEKNIFFIVSKPDTANKQKTILT